jgi:hypothetical protein
MQGEVKKLKLLSEPFKGKTIVEILQELKEKIRKLSSGSNSAFQKKGETIVKEH